MANKLAILLDEIQVKHRLTLEQIAARIGFSRPYLNKMKKEGGNDKIERLLKEAFPEAIQKETKKDNGSIHTETLIKTLQDHNETLKQLTIEKVEKAIVNLAALSSEIKVNQELLVSLIASQTAKADVIMNALDELQGRQKGTLSSESDTKEKQFHTNRKKKDRQGVENNEGK